MSIWCQVCCDLKPVSNATQLIPCLHTFCNQCLTDVSKIMKVCPAPHCYSLLTPPDNFISPCDSERCLRKIAVGSETTRTICHHDLCQFCLDSAIRRDRLQCPVNGCGETMLEDEELCCDGPCKQMLPYDKATMTPCCGARLCPTCFQKNTEGSDFCKKGRCIIKCSGKKKANEAVVKLQCQGAANCEGETLRNFPSEFECDHDVCLSCVSAMLDICEKEGKSPHCPQKNCNIPYRCDSVLALKALLPERESFFSKFSLSVHFSMQVLKDDTIAEIMGPDSFGRFTEKITIKTCHCDDEENIMSFDFAKDGSLGDLIREIRRVLKILLTDKIYGYYRRDELCAQPIQLEVSQQTIRSSVSELSIGDNSTILVDVSGIVSCEKKKPCS